MSPEQIITFAAVGFVTVAFAGFLTGWYLHAATTRGSAPKPPHIPPPPRPQKELAPHQQGRHSHRPEPQWRIPETTGKRWAPGVEHTQRLTATPPTRPAQGSPR